MLHRGGSYTSVPSVTFSGGGGSGAAGTAVMRNSRLDGVTITNPGSGYPSAPTVTFSAPPIGHLWGARGTAVLQSGVASAMVTNGGSGYTSAPTVSFSGGGGSGATATASVVFRADEVTVTNGGSGYTSAPTVTFSAPATGTAATGTAVMAYGGRLGDTRYRGERLHLGAHRLLFGRRRQRGDRQRGDGLRRPDGDGHQPRQRLHLGPELSPLRRRRPAAPRRSAPRSMNTSSGRWRSPTGGAAT